MCIELKIKVKNLADEARTIRAEERKCRGLDRYDLQLHRKTVVRMAARRTQIARQIIRGRDWEANASHDPHTRQGDWKEVSRMVKKYGTDESIARLKAVHNALMVYEEARTSIPQLSH